MGPTVHILLYGQTLCRQVHGLPKHWGKEHRCIGIDDPKRDKQATCKICRDTMKQIEEEREATHGE